MKPILMILGLSLAMLVLPPGTANAQSRESPGYHEGHFGDIPYLMGGVSIEEREELTTLAKDYYLKLIFSMSSGEYVSQPKVVVRDLKGHEIFQAESDGPWLLVKLPAGEYKITASMEG